MKRTVITLVTLLLLSSAAAANPFAKAYHWTGQHKRFLVMEGAAVTAAVIHYKGMEHCRQIDRERCDEGYGAAHAFFGVVTAVNVVVLPAVAEGCWKAGHGNFCYVFAYGGSATQAGWGAHEWTLDRQQKKEKDDRDLLLARKIF